MNKTFKVEGYSQFNRPKYRIVCKQNGLVVLETVGESLILANRIKKFLEEECQDIE